ncbi:MAG: hypothetical protein EXR53_05560 [Dehalococcoidia bacterium]|nr:hypothetical protein [Dehalococcoidia bacterium]
MKAFNVVDNAMDDTVSKISFPQSLNTAAELIAYNAAITQYLTALEGVIRRLAEIQSATLEPDTTAHLLKARSLAETARQVMVGMQQALSSGNVTAIQQQISKLQASEAELSSLKRGDGATAAQVQYLRCRG